MAAPPALRARLWPLYAFNLEVARAPWLTAEPLIAEMRLQFWTDTLTEAAGDAPPRAHEVAAPLTEVIRAQALPTAPLHALIEARKHDIARAAFTDAGALLGYIDATAGGLMLSAARLLGAGDGAEAPIRAMGRAAGLANWLAAVPALRAAGAPPLGAGIDRAALVAEGLAQLHAARAARAQVPAAAAPALLTGWQAGAILKRAAREPAAIDEGRLLRPEIARRGSLLLRALSGRW